MSPEQGTLQPNNSRQDFMHMRQLLIATVALVLLQPAFAASADAGDAIAGLTAKLDSFKANAPFERHARDSPVQHRRQG